MCCSWSVLEDTAEILIGVLLSGSLVFWAVTTISAISFDESVSAARAATAAALSPAAMNTIVIFIKQTLPVSARDGIRRYRARKQTGLRLQAPQECAAMCDRAARAP